MLRRYPQKKKKGKSFSFFTKFFIFLSFGIFSFAITHEFLQQNNTKFTCANSKSCKSDLSVKIENNVSGIFEGKKISPPIVDLASESLEPVLGASTAPGEKHIYVDLSTQTLFAYQGTTLVLKTFVSSGKWKPTPVGNFHIWEKLRATRMTGGEGADAYDLPNVQYVMYFYNDFGLHQAYWHDNFGHTMSHGCVNLRLVDAKALYEWADGPSGQTQGTAVSTCDQITKDNQCIQNNPIQ